ncbi:MAG: tetratricopeptide repeat protein [Desulfomonile tiedjei]|nr:tetratricopeptide repeat protein [Desulfomonile tiedjei]
MKALFALITALSMLSAFVPGAAQAQSKQDAKRLHNEAVALKEKAKSNEDLKQALQKYQEALGIYDKVGEREDAAYAYNDIGTIYAGWGEYRQAVEYYGKSLAIKRKFGDLKGEGQSLGNLGNVHLEWGQYGKAVEYYEKELAICRKLGDLKGESMSLTCLGIVHSARSQYGKAVEYYEKSLELSRKIGDVKTEGKTLNNLGCVYSDWGQYGTAVEYYEKSLELSRKIGDVRGEGSTLGNLGTVYWHWGQYQKAIELHEESAEMARKLGNQKTEANALGNLGNVYTDWGQYGKTVEYYEKSLELSRKIGDVKTEGKTLNNLGNVYRDWGQYQKAVEYYEKSLELSRKVGDVKTEGNTLNNLGRVYQTWGEYDKALKHFEQGLAIYKKTGIPATLAIMSIGNLYLDTGQIDQAEPFVKQANVSVCLGLLSLGKRDWAAAKRFYETELKRAEMSRRTDTLFTSYTGLGMVSEGLGENSSAAASFRKAVDLTETLRSSLNEAERETFFDVKIGGFYRTVPYEGLARVLTKMNKPLEALKQSEYTKARLFAEAISNRGGYTGRDVPKEIREEDAALANELAALTKSLQKGYQKENKDIIASLEPQVNEAKAKQAAHVQMLREKYPLFAATKYPQPMDMAQTALKENEWVLSYDVGDPGLIIYLTKGRELKKALCKPVSRKELDTLVRNFREPLDIRPEENILEKIVKFDFESGKKLADILLSDILPELPKDAPLIIVPADCLGVLPFEMLVLNDGGIVVMKDGIPNTTGAQFFGDRNPISYYQSITALTLARNFGKQQSSGNKLLVMCDPVFSDDDPRFVQAKHNERIQLLNMLTKDILMSAKSQNGVVWPRMALTKKLGDDLKKNYPNAADVCEGLQATKAAFKQKDLTQYGSIVFGTHGYAGMDLGGLKEPVLVLTLVNQPDGEDGFLRQSEVMGLKMNSNIVALTACQSGLGKRISGEGTMGMGRAFQYAGAKSVLMTLWSVAQDSSVQLTDSFFRHLKEGKPKLEALKSARDEIRKNGYDHPFFWAPFILVGEVE